MQARQVRQKFLFVSLSNYFVGYLLICSQVPQITELLKFMCIENLNNCSAFFLFKQSSLGEAVLVIVLVMCYCVLVQFLYTLTAVANPGKLCRGG